MGVDIHQYLMIGVKLDYDTYMEKFEDYDNKLDDYIRFISDGMDGEYFYIGHVVEECDEFSYLPSLFNGFNFLKKKYKKDYKKVKENVVKYLNEGEKFEVDIFYIKHYY